MASAFQEASAGVSEGDWLSRPSVYDGGRSARKGLEVLPLVALLVMCAQEGDAPAVPDPRVVQSSSEAMPERRWTLDLGNPLRSFEVNSGLRHAVGELVGKGSDVLGIKGRLDGTAAGRIVLIGTHAVLADALEVTSHELAHIREARRHGPLDASFRFVSLTNFGENFPKRYGYTPTADQLLGIVVAGLNQDEYNAYVMVRAHPDQITVDTAVSFLLAKFFQSYENVVVRDMRDGNDVSDVKTYLMLLNARGIGLTKQDHASQAALANLLSLTTWASLGAVIEYAADGRRTFRVPTFSVVGVEATFPLISYFLTPRGGFYNVTSFLNPRAGTVLELSVGTDVDFIGDGRVDLVRLGAQYDLGFGAGGASLHLRPFAYLGMEKSLTYDGIATGLEILWQMTRRLGVKARLEFNRNDVIENVVKVENNGFNLLVSVVAQ